MHFVVRMSVMDKDICTHALHTYTSECTIAIALYTQGHAVLICPWLSREQIESQP